MHVVGWRCDKCQREFSSSQALGSHRGRNGKGGVYKRVRCAACDAEVVACTVDRWRRCAACRPAEHPVTTSVSTTATTTTTVDGSGGSGVDGGDDDQGAAEPPPPPPPPPSPPPAGAAGGGFEDKRRKLKIAARSRRNEAVELLRAASAGDAAFFVAVSKHHLTKAAIDDIINAMSKFGVSLTPERFNGFADLLVRHNTATVRARRGAVCAR